MSLPPGGADLKTLRRLLKFRFYFNFCCLLDVQACTTVQKAHRCHSSRYNVATASVVDTVTLTLLPDMVQMLWEYLLVYCTSHFLRAIGEPPAPGHLSYQQVASIAHDIPQPLPVWIMFLFSLLTCFRFIIGFLVSAK